jgi:pyocin large subunit-like protein
MRPRFNKGVIQNKSPRQIPWTTSSGLILLLVLFALVVVAFNYACNSSSTQTPSSQSDKTPTASLSQSQSVITHPNIGFASRQRLIDHYQKHGHEFGSISLEEYLHEAQKLRDRPAGGIVLEAVKPDGVITRLDRASGAFIAFNPDRVIRTYFRPAEGEAYFWRQSRRKN